MSRQVAEKTVDVKKDIYSVGILPVEAKHALPNLTLKTKENVSKARSRDDKKDREYVERIATFVASDNKSYSALVNQLPQPGYRK